MLTKEEKKEWFDKLIELEGKNAQSFRALLDSNGKRCCIGVFCELKGWDDIHVFDLSFGNEVGDYYNNKTIYNKFCELVFDEEQEDDDYKAIFTKMNQIYKLNTRYDWSEDFCRKLDKILPGDKVYEEDQASNED